MFVGAMLDDGTTQIWEAEVGAHRPDPRDVLLLVGSDNIQEIEACFEAVSDMRTISSEESLPRFTDDNTSHYVYGYFANERMLSWGDCFYIGKGKKARWLDHVRERVPGKRHDLQRLKAAKIDEWIENLGSSVPMTKKALGKAAPGRLVCKLGQWNGPYSELQAFVAEYFLITGYTGVYALSNRTRGNTALSEVRILGRNVLLAMDKPNHVKGWTQAVHQFLANPYEGILMTRIAPGLHLLANENYFSALAGRLETIGLYPHSINRSRPIGLDDTPAHYSVEGAADPCLTFSTRDNRPYRFQLKLSMHSPDVMVNVRSKIDGVAGAQSFETYYRSARIEGRPLESYYAGHLPIRRAGSPDPYFKPFAKDGNGRNDTKFAISGSDFERDILTNWCETPLTSDLMEALRAFLAAFPAPLKD